MFTVVCKIKQLTSFGGVINRIVRREFKIPFHVQSCLVAVTLLLAAVESGVLNEIFNLA